MATKKAAGSTKNGRDSVAKRLGVKLFGGQLATAGNIIIRQRGTKFFPGQNVGMGKDHTLFALIDGVVSYTEKRTMKFNGQTHRDKYAHVLPSATETTAAPKAEKKAAEKPVKKTATKAKKSTVK